jgi:D-alanine-D-alanine ligase
MVQERDSGRTHVREPASAEAELGTLIDRLKSHLRLAVIYGGNKETPGGVVYPARNTRAWKSYEAVAVDIATALQRLGFRHVELMPDDMRLADRLVSSGTHMAWLNTGGVQGSNPMAHAPSLLEMLGVPYLGHDPLAVTTLDNKHAFKREAVCAGLPTAPFATWHMRRGRFDPDVNTRFHRAFGSYDGPFVVKPVSGRASLHVHVVPDRRSLPDVVAAVYDATENVVLIEKFLSGSEYCIAVAGPVHAVNGVLRRNPGPLVFSALERILSPDERIFTSMDVRPITDERCRNLDPDADAAALAELRRIGHEVFLEFNLSSVVRLDLRADQDGVIHILEANPKPDLKAPGEGVMSLISAGLPGMGMSYDDLILSLFADRFDDLVRRRRDTIGHIMELLKPAAARRAFTESYHEVAHASAVAESSRATVDALATTALAEPGPSPTAIGEIAADASVRALAAVAGSARMGRRHEAATPKRRAKTQL